MKEEIKATLGNVKELLALLSLQLAHLDELLAERQKELGNSNCDHN